MSETTIEHKNSPNESTAYAGIHEITAKRP